MHAAGGSNSIDSFLVVDASVVVRAVVEVGGGALVVEDCWDVIVIGGGGFRVSCCQVVSVCWGIASNSSSMVI